MLLAAATNEMFHLYEAKEELSLLSAGTFGGWMDIIESAWSSGLDHITFMTSGSTGPAKMCVHQLSHLQTEILYLADVFSSRKRIVALAPAHHIYGFLLTAMLPDQLGLEVVSAEHVDPCGLARSFRKSDLIVSIPDYWQWLNQTSLTWPEEICGVVSTAPCPAPLIRSLMQKGLNDMLEIYGSSETSGIGVRAWPDNSYRLMPHWRRGHSNDPEQTDLIHASGIQVRLMDRIEFLEDGSFLLAGRRDGAVQVGGMNVYPARIASLLLARPGVAKVAVRLMRPEEGVRLKAFIVPIPGASVEDVRGDLEKWIEKYLNVVERPKAMKFGLMLPIISPGEALDW
jgi:4-coumarate--CoA ligase (photoactive yellow protein activation family)